MGELTQDTSTVDEKNPSGVLSRKMPTQCSALVGILSLKLVSRRSEYSVLISL